MDREHTLTVIVPSNDLDASEVFYQRLGFTRPDGPDYDGYRILADNKGGHLHLTQAVEGWVVPGRNPFGVYLYTEEVDRLAEICRSQIIEKNKRPEDKPWGMYEFALSDPDGTLVRIGWPTHLRSGRNLTPSCG
jgi:hypothetical protein